jgi:hypothetical protein
MGDQIVANSPSTPTCSRKPRRSPVLPRAEDFRVTVRLPSPLPVSDRELRAIEILLGIDLKELLADNYINRNQTPHNS